MHKMYQTNKLNFLILSPIIFLFIPSMYISGGIPVYDIIIGLVILCLIISNKNKEFLKQLVSYKKYNFIVVLCLYILWVLLSGLILIIMGKYNFVYALYAIFILFLYNNFSWFLYPSLVFPRFYSLKQLIKFILIGIYIVCIYGLLVFLFDKFSLPILKPIHNIIVNRGFFEAMNTNSGEFVDRVFSVFEEPGYLGGFLVINLPIIYSTILSKYKILKNNKLNILFKKSYLPLVISVIIMTKSPIWLIFFMLVTFVYFYKSLFSKYLIKALLVIMFILLPIFITFKNVDVSTTYLSRISNTISTFSDMTLFVLKEPSLANRILSYIVRVKIFEEYPITGIGYKNTEYHAKDFFYNLNMPLTQETQINLLNTSPKMGMNGAIFWNSLSDTGIVGTFFYYLFLIVLIKKANTISKQLPEGLEQTFLIALKKVYLTILCLSFYDLRPNFHYFWFMFGIMLVYLKKYKFDKFRRNIE